LTDATGTVNLFDVPAQLASALGIPEFAAGLLLSLVITLLCILSILIISKGKAVSSALIIGVAACGFCTAIGWFPAWLLVVLCLITAAGVGVKIKGLF
jgi:hypothetical protein